MKRIVMIALVTIAACSAAFGQSRMTQEQKEEAMARYREYMEELKLTEEQKPKVEEINRTFFEGISNLRNSNGSRMEKYRTFKHLRAERDREMKKVLTEKQYSIYKERQKEQKENFRSSRQ